MASRSSITAAALRLFGAPWLRRRVGTTGRSTETRPAARSVKLCCSCRLLNLRVGGSESMRLGFVSLPGALYSQTPSDALWLCRKSSGEERCSFVPEASTATEPSAAHLFGGGGREGKGGSITASGGRQGTGQARRDREGGPAMPTCGSKQRRPPPGGVGGGALRGLVPCPATALPHTLPHLPSCVSLAAPSQGDSPSPLLKSMESPLPLRSADGQRSGGRSVAGLAKRSTSSLCFAPCRQKTNRRGSSLGGPDLCSGISPVPCSVQQVNPVAQVADMAL